MSSALPIELALAWTIFFGSVSTHQRHASNFHGASQGIAAALKLSTVLGALVGFTLLLYYFTRVSWYWPIILFAVGSIAGGLLFGLLDKVTPQPTLSLLSFFIWPAAAIWTFVILRGNPW